MAFDGCVLCGNPRFKPQPVHGPSGGIRTATYRDCTLCGAYVITMALEEDITDRRADFEQWLPGLRAYTKQAADAGTLPELRSDNFRQLANGHLHTPIPEKLRRVLDYLGKRSRVPGDIISIDPDAYPLFDVAEAGHMGFLLEALVERGDIRLAERKNNLGHPQWIVTMRGWERLTPSLTPGGIPGTVFVAMAFTDDMNAAFDAAIRPAVYEDCGLSVTQVGRVQHNDSITDLILAGLRAAQIVIADVTHQRNGVYFEGGFGMGLGRSVVWMCREDDLANVHFDTRNYNHIVWATHEDLRTKLRERLRATLALPARLA